MASSKKAIPFETPTIESGGRVRAAHIEEFSPADLARETIPSYTGLREAFTPDRLLESASFELSPLISAEMSRSREDEKRFHEKVELVVQERIHQILGQETQRGYQEGLERGRSEAYQAESARVEQMVSALTAAQDAMEQSRSELSRFYEKSVLDVAFRLSELVVRSHFEHRPEEVKHVLADILQKISKTHDVVIRLSAKQADAVNVIKDHLEKTRREGHIVFEVDESLSDGDCVVESANGEVGAIIDEEFKKLREIVYRSMAQTTRPDNSPESL